jgi:hypothetical protein
MTCLVAHTDGVRNVQVVDSDVFTRACKFDLSTATSSYSSSGLAINLIAFRLERCFPRLLNCLIPEYLYSISLPLSLGITHSHESTSSEIMARDLLESVILILYV